MKNWLKKIGENKFQIIFFAGISALLIVAIVLASITTPTKTPVTENEDPNGSQVKEPEDPVIVNDVELVQLPLDSNSSYEIVRTFYEKDAPKEQQVKSLIKYQNSYRTSTGTSYALKTKETFNVLASLSGQVAEIGKSPLFGNYLVITTDDNIKTYYYGLGEIKVAKGDTVKQGAILGLAGTSEIDKQLGIHLYFQIEKKGKFINPEKAIGSKISDL